MAKAKAKHTPGPWALSDNGLGVFGPGEEWGIAQILLYCSTGEGIPDEEQKANARLIASAPDLLALARAYEAWEADLVLNGDWSGSCVRMTQSQHDRMIEIQAMRNAAVAKATGK